MGKKAFESLRRGIGNTLARAFVDYLQEHVYKNATLDAIADRLHLQSNVFHSPWWQDIPQICDATNLDLGLVIRDNKGHELTFWPEHNFGEPFAPPKEAQKEPSMESKIKTYHARRKGEVLVIE